MSAGAVVTAAVTGTAGSFDPVLGSLAVVQGIAVVLLARPRERTRVRPGVTAYASVVPSITIGVLSVGVAPPGSEWPAAAQAVFIAGAIWTAVSLVWLGRSFSIVPAARSLVWNGPYRVVRHPAYLGEGVMTAACVAAALGSRPPSVPAVLAVVAGAGVLTAAIVWRITVEERCIAGLEGWDAYSRRTRHRLLPGVW